MADGAVREDWDDGKDGDDGDDEDNGNDGNDGDNGGGNVDDDERLSRQSQLHLQPHPRLRLHPHLLASTTSNKFRTMVEKMIMKITDENVPIFDY